jgi:putative transposase
MGVSRSALAYQSARAAKDVPALARMAELSAQYPRYGYRRIAIFLARDGHPMSFGRAHRLWRQARLQVPQKRPRKRIAAGRPRPKSERLSLTINVRSRTGGRQPSVEL